MSKVQNNGDSQQNSGKPENNRQLPVDNTIDSVLETEPEITNIQQENSNMETHAHHLHKAPGNKLWHYFYEFLMLFLAVFCGFLAEYQLEHKIERERGREYAISYREDMLKDTAMLQKNIIALQIISSNMDSITQLIWQGRINTNEEIKKLYENNITALAGYTIDLIDRTSSQLKNSGGMRLITNKKVIEAIIDYWNNMERLDKIDGYAQIMRSQAREKSYLVFDAKYYSTSLDANGKRRASDGAKLMTKDYIQLAEYANRINHIKNLIRTSFMNSLKKQKDKASKLIDLIEKEYPID